MDQESRNQEIRNLLDLWQWCSRTLHVQWERKRKYRNGCLFGLTSAINESQFGANVSPYQLPLVYRDLAEPLFNDLGLLAFWEDYPTSLLDMCLGCFTKGSPLIDRLNRLRLKRQDNPALDKLFKKMRGREERYGWDWSVEGHHPEGEFVPGNLVSRTVAARKPSRFLICTKNAGIAPQSRNSPEIMAGRPGRSCQKS